MDYEEFTTLAGRSKEIWRSFKDSLKDHLKDPAFKEFLKHSHPVLSCPSGQCALEATDYPSVALWSPRSLVPNRASISLIAHVQALDRLKKEIEGRRSKEEGLKKEMDKAKAWIDEFDPKRLDFQEHRLEVRFPFLNMGFMQKIRQSPFVDQQYERKDRLTIRVVLLMA